MTGRGAGLSDAGLQKKIHAIETAVAVNRPDPADVLDVLHKVCLLYTSSEVERCGVPWD